MTSRFASITQVLLLLAACGAHIVVDVSSRGCVCPARPRSTGCECTNAVTAALKDISAAGGGVLYFPPGTWETSPFNLSANSVLLLDRAILAATRNMSAWPLIAPLPSYGQGRDHSPITWERYGAFIGAYNVSNITITTNSTGIIHGQGIDWWRAHETNSLCCTPGHLIEMWADDVEIGAPVGFPPQSLTLKDSPFWHVHLYSGNNAWVHDVTIESDPLYENTDGVDPDSYTNVLIERLHYFGGDDGVAVKSGWDAAGIAYGRATENVTVRDSVISSPRAACVCIGSEMSGGVRNVSVLNVSCSGAATGMYVKSAPGRGGYVVDFSFTDSVMYGVNTAFELSLNYGDHPSPPCPWAPGGTCWNASALPSPLQGFTLARVTGNGVGKAGSLQGIAGANFTDILVQDVAFDNSGGWTCNAFVSGAARNVTPAPCSQLSPTGL